MARASALSKALVAAGALMALRLLSGETFVTPKQRNEAAAAMAAAMDAYSQNDNPINPYSQFSDGSDTVYQAKNQPEMERRTKSLKAGLKRFEDTPGYIQTKQAQALKSNLQESNSLRQDLLYFSGAEGSPAWEKARQFVQKVGTMGVDGNSKQWKRAAEDYKEASNILAEWKSLSSFN
ncbi:unnamed protein product [Durusdinium trenchii]|uniref:Uncharacterized protein n=1 Tax=Durusdinium trenchii TaxID=1381693 RepID=A0ABP0N7U9_9DINO